MPAIAAAVRASLRDAVFLIQLDDPTGVPRLTRAVLAELHRQLEAFADATSARSAVLTGTARCFAAGAELAEVGALTPLEALRFSALGQSLMRKIERSEKPVVAAIRGHCLGGGFDLALACHLRVAANDAVFGHPGARLGIITGWGGTQRLPRLVGPQGRARLVEILSTARTLTAGEAHALGLVNQVVPPHAAVDAAIRFARRAAARNRRSSS